jgi:hypothetical protein
VKKELEVMGNDAMQLLAHTGEVAAKVQQAVRINTIALRLGCSLVELDS